MLENEGKGCRKKNLMTKNYFNQCYHINFNDYYKNIKKNKMWPLFAMIDRPLILHFDEYLIHELS
jgi:aromatic ring hydroxylase